MIAPMQGALAAANDLVPGTAFKLDGNIAGPNDWGDALGTGFYGSGTTPSGYPTTGIIDWTTATDACGGGDTTRYQPGTKWEHDPWPTVTGSPNTKSDLCKGAAAIEVVNVNGQYQYIYYAMLARDPNASGDMSGFLPLEGPLAGRVDDKLVEFDYNSNGGGSIDLTIYKWSGSAWVPDASVTDPMYGYGIGANTSATTGGHANGARGTLVEFAINLTTSGILSEQTCQSFSSSGGMTRTGNGKAASLEDYMYYEKALKINTCNTLTISKETDPAGTPGGPFKYLLNQQGLPTAAAVHDSSLRGDGDDPGEPDSDYSEINGSLTVPTDKTDTWTNVIAEPDYKLAETDMPDGWETKSIQCTYKDIFTGQTVTQDVYPKGTFQIPPSSLAPGGTDCVITNSTSTITIVKEGAGSGDDKFTFSLTGKDDVDLTINDSTAPIAYKPGTKVTITEALPNVSPAWVSYGATCVDDTTKKTLKPADKSEAVEVTTVAGHNITCTFTNQQKARIKVSKSIADSTQKFDFNWSANPGGSLSLGDGESSGWIEVEPNKNVVAGATPGPSYSVTENAYEKYSLGNIDCDDPSGDSTTDVSGRTATYAVSPGESVDCEFVNVENGSITIIKDAQPNGPQDFSFTAEGQNRPTGMASFKLDDDDDATLSNSATFENIKPGTYTVTEAATSGWDLSKLVCTDSNGNNSTGEVSTATATIKVDPKDTIVCTFTNVRKSAKLTLTKKWVNATEGDRVNLSSQVTLDGVAAATDNGYSISNGPTEPADTNNAVSTIYSGSTVNLAEAFVGDEAAGHYDTSLACVDADGKTYTEADGLTVDGLTGKLSVSQNPVDLTCTFTNAHKVAKLVLKKDWASSPVTDDKESVELEAKGYISTDSATDTNGGDHGQVEVAVGLFHPVNLSETFVTGSAERFDSTLTCDGGTLEYTDGELTGTVIPGADDAGKTITCTFTNKRATAVVTLQKEWVHGAPADKTELFLNGINDGTATSTVPALPADMSTYNPTYLDSTNTVTETVYAGETIELGEALSPDNVGTYTKTGICRNEAKPDDPIQLWSTGSTGTVTVPDSLSGWGDADGDGTVELTCTVTNRRLQSTLTLEKYWLDAEASDTVDLTATAADVPDTDTKVSTADGSVGLYQPARVQSLDAQGQPINGEYDNVATIQTLSGSTAFISETIHSAKAAYKTGKPVCTYLKADLTTATAAVTASTDASGTAGYLVEIPDNGNAVNCAFTNEAPRGSITIVKSVNGEDDTFYFNPSWLDERLALQTEGQVASQMTRHLLGGTYTVSETDISSRFDFTKLECIGGEDVKIDGLTATINLADEEDVVCTYTNTQKATVVVAKEARPSSTQAFPFAVSAKSTGAVVPANLVSFDLTDDGTRSLNVIQGLVTADREYSVLEKATAGWRINTDESSCSDGTKALIPIDEQGAVTVTPTPGSTVVCTYVNEVVPATLTLTKSAVGTPADYGWEFNFNLTPDAGARTISGVGATPESVTWDGLTIGKEYTLTEEDLPGWTEGDIVCDGIEDLDSATEGIQFTVEPAQEITCSVENQLKPGSITLEKSATLTLDANGDGVGQTDDQISWTFVVTNTSEVPVNNVAIDDDLLNSLDMPITCDSTTLAAAGAEGDSTTCHAGPYTVTSTDVATMESIYNIATARGTLPEPPGGGTPPKVTSNPDDADVPLEPRPGIKIDKTALLNDANGDGIGQAGETITFKFKVTNTGDIKLKNVKVDDPMLAEAGLAIACEETTLTPGQSTQCVAEDYTITEADAKAGSVYNVATSTGEIVDCPTCGGDPKSPPDETDTPTNDPKPGMTIVKSAVLDDTNDDGVAQPGEKITYSFKLKNTGETNLTDVKVNDPMLQKIDLKITCEAKDLAIGESTNCVAEPYTVTEADVTQKLIANVATGTGRVEECEDCEVVTPPGKVTTPTVVPDLPKTGSASDAMAGLLALLLPVGVALAIRRRSARR